MNNDTKASRDDLMLETYEWDQTWIECTEDRAAPRVLYIGDSISIPTRVKLNEMFGETIRFDGFASSKAADHPYLTESIRLFTLQQTTPYRAVLFNNGLHGWHLDDDMAYPQHYERVVTELTKLFPHAELCILTTTPVADPDRDARVRSRNRSAEMTAGKYGLRVIDLYNAAPELPSYLSEDGVHFTDSGYRILAEAAAPVLKQL